jgi:hypothetical protein
MISMQAYIDEATQEGDLWRLTGAAFAVDYDPEPETRTHVICSDWIVDLESGTATWTSSSDEFFPDEEISSDDFADTYAETCT